MKILIKFFTEKHFSKNENNKGKVELIVALHIATTFFDLSFFDPQGSRKSAACYHSDVLHDSQFVGV